MVLHGVRPAGSDPTALQRGKVDRLGAVEGARHGRQRVLETGGAVEEDGALVPGDPPIRQAAATEILDRFHGKPKQSIDATVHGPVSITLTWGDDSAADDGDTAGAP